MSHILYSASAGVATITLNRPEKLNSFAGTMRDDLAAALLRAENDPGIRVVVITGAGRAFSAGGDVDAMQVLREKSDVQSLGLLLDAGREIVTRIRTMPQFVIAAVNGVAAGAGCNLALACDYRIAAESATFGETFVRIGLHPDWGGTWFLPRLAGTSRALELLLTGRMIDARESLALGLVDRVEPDARLLDAVMELAQRVVSGPPIPLAGIKRAVYAAAQNDLAAQTDLEAGQQERAFLSEDAAEGMRAFSEKRAPDFKGV
jgi:2-(1,2-epoxy-1,2-dihydrophenyl)acetyl-CoA isomerase